MKLLRYMGSVMLAIVRTGNLNPYDSSQETGSYWRCFWVSTYMNILDINATLKV